MGDQRRPTRNVFLFFLLLAIGAWMLPGEFDWTFTLRWFFGVAAVVMLFAWLLQSPRAKVEAPDILREQIGNYFERDGLCFAARLSVEDGLCRFNVVCQNRYIKPCFGTICFVPVEGMSKDGSHLVAPLIADVECAGGEVGVVSFPYPIALKWQGKIMVYDVMAKVKYPHGYGKLVRTPEGAPVGEITTDAMQTLKMAGALMFGHLRLEKIASCELRLPQGVVEIVPSEAVVRTEVLWEWQEPARYYSIASEQAPHAVRREEL
jgi:hypothetical protein